MSTKTKKVTKAQQRVALAAVAEWLGHKGLGTLTPCGTCESCVAGLKYDWQCENPAVGPAPTGEEAARHGLGPVLRPEWDWPSGGPTPTIILEGGPYDWAVEVAFDETVLAKTRAAGLFIEPYSGWALCLYRDDA